MRNDLPAVELDDVPSSPSELLWALSDAKKEIAHLKDALRMLVSEVKSPDEYLQKGDVCGLSIQQQHGIIKARKLLEK